MLYSKVSIEVITYISTSSNNTIMRIIEGIFNNVKPSKGCLRIL